MAQPVPIRPHSTGDSSSAPVGNRFTSLPPGWTTEADPHDGRMFYWHAATGTSSWTHPNAPPPPPVAGNNSHNPRSPSYDYIPAPSSSSNNNNNDKATTNAMPPMPPQENPYMASRRPDNHQCSAIGALILCPPLGAFALYHSIRVDQCWKAGQYSDAVIHSRQGPQFSSWGIMIGIVFWICWFFFRRGRGEWEWPDWRLGD